MSAQTRRPEKALLLSGIGRSFLGVLLRKLFGGFDELFLVPRKFFGEIGPQRMVGFGIVDEGDQALDDLIRLCRRLPILRRDNRQADLSLLVNVGVVDSCLEGNLRRFEGIFGRKIDFDAKRAPVVRRVLGDDKALPAENVRVIHVDITKRLQS